MAVCALLCYSNFPLQANDHIKNQPAFARTEIELVPVLDVPIALDKDIGAGDNGKRLMTGYAEYEARLHALRDEMTGRINALDKDIHHHEQAVEKDFSEQVTQRENDEVINALDQEARTIVQQIDRALLSIKEDA